MVQWLGRPQGTVVTFYPTQVLMGHGCFRSYLCSRKRAPDFGCLHCPEVWGDVEHTLFVRLHFRGTRTELERALGRQVAPEDLGKLLWQNLAASHLANDRLRKNVWAREEVLRSTLTIMIETILTEKEEDGRSREAEERARMTQAARGRRRR